MALEHDDAHPFATPAPEDAEVEDGLRALERYLGRHAAFDRWCRDHVRRYGSEPGGRGEDDADAGEPPAAPAAGG